MKKIPYLFVALLTIMVSACNNTNYNVDVDFDADYVIFDKLEKGSNYNCKEFKKAIATKYKDNQDGISFKDSNFKNYIPSNIAKYYGIGVFIGSVDYLDSNTGEKLNSRDWCCFYCNGGIYKLNAICDKKEKFDLVNFLVTDMNRDGYFEYTISFNEGTPIKNWATLYTLDTKTNKMVHTLPDYRTHYVFSDEFGRPSIYYLNGGFYSEIVSYKRKYKLAIDEIMLSSENYTLKLSLEENDLSTPLIYNGLHLYFNIKIELTWLGETFSYESETTSPSLPEAYFHHGDRYLNTEARGYWFGKSDWTIHTNDVINSNFRYFDSCSSYNPSGIYDLIVDYRGETVTLENALTISEV